MLTEEQSTIQSRRQAIRPFLRWAGGKQWIARQIARSIPSTIGTYFEPFLGGGSVYFSALPVRAVLTDLNRRLIEAYKAVRDEPQGVIDTLGRWDNNEHTYYSIRDKIFDDNIHRAAQLIYLNRTCWNGLYRVNLKGRFNVPFGNHGRVVFNPDHLVEVSNALCKAEIEHGDFADFLTRAKRSDFIYLDPPYVSMEPGNSFRKYNENVFSWRDQERLGRVALTLADRGCYVVVSSALHEATLDLFPGFAFRRLSRRSIVAARARHRGETFEYVLASDPMLLAGIDNDNNSIDVS